MQIIPIQAIPNQTFNISLDNKIYGLSIKETNGVMSVSITRDNISVVSNLRAMAGSPLLPSEYEESGNFIFVTGSFQIPYYTKFNITQSLRYYSQSELEIFRDSSLMFNPIASVPLRYKPQGYTLAP